MISIHQNEYHSAICSVRCPTDSKVKQAGARVRDARPAAAESGMIEDAARRLGAELQLMAFSNRKCL
jgi:hypothetical protein